MSCLHLEKSQGAFLFYFKWFHHSVGRGLWRIGEVWGDDSLSEEAEDVRADCRWTVLWKSLLLIRTTSEKRRSWKWLKERKSTNKISQQNNWKKIEKKYFSLLHLLQFCWRLGLISADDEQRKEDGEQAAAR